MKNFLPNTFNVFIAFALSAVSLFGNNDPENFCFNADLPEAQADFSVMCLTAPVIICPSTYLGCPGDNLDPVNTGQATAMPGDSFCPQPILSYTDVVVTNTPCLTVIHRTWKAEYPAGSASIKLHSECQQTLFLEDTAQPVISNCPSNIVVDLAGNCAGIATWNLPTASDDCGIMSFTTTHFSGTSFPMGTTTVTYTAEDFCGNTVTCSFTVTVQGSCCTTPAISCPNDVAICIGSSTDPSNTGTAFAAPSDPSCPTPTVTFNDVITNLAGCNGQAQSILRTWTASDPTGLTNSCNQTIVVNDTQNPSITSIPADITISATGVNCSAPVTWNIPNATDNCGVSTFNGTHTSGTTFPQGSTLVTYTAVDNCGNQSTAAFQVTVICTGCSANPIINCPPTYTGCPNSGVPNPGVSGFASATPGASTCGTPVVTWNDVVVTSGGTCGAQTINRIWTATDPNDSNFSSTCTQTLILADTQVPVILGMPSNISVNGTGNPCSAPVSWTAPTATDNCGLASLTSSHPNGGTFNQGTTVVTYTALDNCGLTTTATFTVTVTCAASCTNPPLISCPPAYSGCANGAVPNPSVSGFATATPGSATCGTPNVTFNDVVVSNGPCAGAFVINRVWTATDPTTGLSASCTQVISTQDNVNPTFLSCPSSVTVMGSGTNCVAAATWVIPVATDNCGSPNLSSLNQNGQAVTSGSIFNQGTNTVTYTATDGCGNVATCAFNVTVTCAPTCNVPPTINCPANQLLCVGANTSPTALGFATATGGPNCPTPQVTYQDVTISTGTCGDIVIKRVWTASYPSGSGLTSSCEQIITLEDKIAPAFINCPANITVTNPSTVVTWNAPTATDACGTPNITSNYVSGSTFPVGTTVVVYSAIDACGNASNCTFTVTVTGASATLTCPANMTLQCGGNGGAIAHWTPPVYNGTCGDCNGGTFIPGFIYMGTYNGHQYYCSNSPASYVAAQQICESNGGYLASITTPGENAYLANQLTIQSAWIGLNDVEEEGNFVWESGEPLNYTNWYPGQPNNYNNAQHYCEMLNNGQWNDQYSTYALEFIMEKPCTFIQQVAGPTPGTFLTGGTYTVTYELNDACGGNDQCSFNITVENGLSLNCPANIVTEAYDNTAGVAVNWSPPTANSCCNNCNSAGGAIPGFIYMGQFNGHHYYCSNSPATWNTAQNVCQQNGGNLAVINSAAENAYLANLLTLQSAWIGCSDTASEGNFQWVNGDPLTYTNWYPGQPNNYNGGQDYVEMLNNGQWNDQYNSYALEYIMEISDCLNITQTGGPTPGTVLAPGTSHTVTYTATDGCGNQSSCSFNINVNSVPAQSGYCQSGGLNSTCSYINACIFGEINNKSGNNGGYKDFTNICGTISPGQSYPLLLDPGFGTCSAQKVYWKVWCDFNMDGDFVDQGEYLAYGCNVNALTGMLTMPYTLWTGETVLRISCKLGSYPKTACEVFANGETEDYCIKIVGGDLQSDELDSRSREIAEAVLLTGETAERMVEVFPTPANQLLNVRFDNIDDVESAQIFSIDGKLIQELNIDNSVEIDTRAFNNGMYMLRVNYTDGEAKTEKIVIQH